MRGAGIPSIGGPVSDIELPNPRPLADDEALIAVRAAGVGDLDEIVCQGGVGCRHCASDGVGVEAAGVVTAVGAAVHDRAPGDAVLTRILFRCGPGARGRRS